MSALLAPRLAAQALSRPAGSVLEACRRLLAIQAQDLTQARWALAVRSAGATLATVDQAFASRQVVRAWVGRGTLHVVPAEDLPWLVRLLGPRNLARIAARLRELEISEGDVAAARRVVERTLPGRLSSREELFTELEHAGQGVARQRGVHLLFCLTQLGVLCQAGESFALMEQWLPRPRMLAGEEALGELARRYRVGHGPATVEDLAFWAGLPRGLARRAWDIAGPVEATEAGVPPALLLPGYDEYLLGYADRSACLDARWAEKIVPGGNGVFLPLLVLEGRIRGTWRRRLEPDRVSLALSPFSRLSARERDALEAAASHFGVFHGRPVVVKTRG